MECESKENVAICRIREIEMEVELVAKNPNKIKDGTQ